MNDTTVLFDDDLDGWGAFYAAWVAFGDDANYQKLRHGRDRNKVREDLIPHQPSDIYLLDWPSWPVESLMELGQFHNLTLIDHHEKLPGRVQDYVRDNQSVFVDNKARGADVTNLTDSRFECTVGASTLPPSQVRLCFDANQSAATLAWQFFHQSRPPKLLRHIEDRDLWRFEMEGTEKVLLGLEASGVSVETIGRYSRQPERLMPSGEAIVSYRNEIIDDIVSKAEVLEVEFGESDPHLAAVVNATCLQSEIGDRLLEEYPEADLALIYGSEEIGPDSKIFGSLRAREDGPDVGTLASKAGGGGHENAAGMSTEAKILPSQLHVRPLE